MLDQDKLNIATTEHKILYGIYETLQEIKSALCPIARDTAIDYSTHSRGELMALVKALPVKPAYFNRLSNAELIKLLGK